MWFEKTEDFRYSSPVNSSWGEIATSESRQRVWHFRFSLRLYRSHFLEGFSPQFHIKGGAAPNHRFTRSGSGGWLEGAAWTSEAKLPPNLNRAAGLIESLIRRKKFRRKSDAKQIAVWTYLKMLQFPCSIPTEYSVMIRKRSEEGKVGQVGPMLIRSKIPEPFVPNLHSLSRVFDRPDRPFLKFYRSITFLKFDWNDTFLKPKMSLWVF